MRVIKKIVAFPLIILVSLLGLIAKLFIKLGSLVAGVGILLLAIFAVLALVNKMWTQLGIFGILFVAMLIILLAAVEIEMWAENAMEVLKGI